MPQHVGFGAIVDWRFGDEATITFDHRISLFSGFRISFPNGLFAHVTLAPTVSLSVGDGVAPYQFLTLDDVLRRLDRLSREITDV